MVQCPFKGKPKKSLICSVVLGIWLLSAVVVLPTALYTTIISGQDPRTQEIVHSCVEHWPFGTLVSVKNYFLIILVAEFIIPCAIMIYCYCHVVKKIVHVGKQQFNGTSNAPDQSSACANSWLSKRKKWTRRTCILMVSVLMYMLLWMPYYGYTIYRDFFPSHWKRNSQRINLFYLVETLAMSNNMVNTVVYIVMNRALKRLVMFCCWSRRGTSSISRHQRHCCRLDHGRSMAGNSLKTPKSTMPTAAHKPNFQVHSF